MHAQIMVSQIYIVATDCRGLEVFVWDVPALCDVPLLFTACESRAISRAREGLKLRVDNCTHWRQKHQKSLKRPLSILLTSTGKGSGCSRHTGVEG